MNPETIEWLNELRSMYETNPVQAILIARLEYARLDREVMIALGYDAGRLHDQAYAAEKVNVAMEMLGAAPQAIDNTAALSAREFALTMGMIAFSDGDPPISTAVRERSLDILTGKLSTQELFEILEDSSQERGYGNLGSIKIFKQLAGPLFDIVAEMLLPSLLMRFAALGLPRPQLMAIMGVEAPPPTGKEPPHEETLVQVRERFWKEIADGKSSTTEHPLVSIDHFIKAFEIAALTPEKEDDRAALAYVGKLLLSYIFSAEDLKKIIRALPSIVHREDMGDIVPTLLITLAIQTLGTADVGLCESVAEVISEFVTTRQIDEPYQTHMLILGIRLWLISNHNNLARGLLADLKKRGFPEDMKPNIALTEADVLINSGSKDEACALLRTIIRSHNISDTSLRGQLINKLLSSCPYSEEEGQQWREELANLENQIENPRG